MYTKKDPTKKLLRKQERETRRSQRRFDRQSKRAMRERMRRRYENGGRGPGGFLSRTLADGVPDYMKRQVSTSPFKSDVETRYRDGSRSQYQSRGHSLALKELVEFFRTAGLGEGGKKIIGIPTGRQYEDYMLRQSRSDYNPSGELIGEASGYRERKKDDFEKSYSLNKGKYKQNQKGGKRKSVEIGGEDLNFLQRQLPGLFLERYKVKSKYDPEGELIKRVTTSRAGGRQVERFPTRSELDAMIAEDIRRAQAQNGE